jgi:hypothetical protein
MLKEAYVQSDFAPGPWSTSSRGISCTPLPLQPDCDHFGSIRFSRVILQDDASMMPWDEVLLMTSLVSKSIIMEFESNEFEGGD